MSKLKKDFTPEAWAEKLRNSSYQRAKRGTREAWLTRLLQAMRPHFAGLGIELPANIRVTWGWTANARKTIGQCFSAEASGDKHFELFISPKHASNDPRAIGATLCHELLHTAPNCFSHSKQFGKHCRTLGLEGKLTATYGGPELWAWLDPLLDDLGAFPGAEVNLSAGKKKQGTRMVKCECPDCGVIFRGAQTTLEKAAVDGLLNCPSPKCTGKIELELTGDEEE